MGYNIGPKIGIEGEKEFRQSLRNINDEYKALEAETKAVAAAMANEGDEQKKLENQQKQLNKQIDKQREKKALLEDAVAKATKKYKENSTEVIRLKGAVYDVDATISNLENELADTSKRLENMAEGFEDVGQEAGQAEGAVLDFADVVGANLLGDLASDALQAMGDAVADFAKGMPEAAAEVKAASSQFDQTFGEMEDSARNALEGIADETGITASRMQESFTGIFSFSKTMGADSAEALDLSSRAMLAAADSAAYYDRSIEDTTETLQSFLKGNYENDAALGISATETTRNTAANELYAKSFNELSESQKVDVLLSMVEAGNAASGALGQAAREADSWANVTGELDEAMYQLQATLGNPVLEALIPVIQNVTREIKAMTEVSDWQILRDSVDSFTASMEQADAELAAGKAEIDSTAIVAQTYVKRLQELEEAGLKTAAAQEEYRLTVDELNTLMPDLNLTINEQTGYLDQNTASILANVEQWKQWAFIQLQQEQMASLARSYAEVQQNVTAATVRRTEVEGDLEAVERQLLAMGIDVTKETLEQSATFGVAGNSLMGYSVNVSRLNTEEGKLRTEYVKLRNEYSQLEVTIEEGTQTMAEYEGQLESTAETNGLLQDETAETREEVDLVAEAYAQAKDEARTSIDAQIGLFDQLSMESSMSAAEIIENWQAQQHAFLNYEDNLKKAVDMGLDEALVRQLADGSEQSMAILNELVNSTETNVAEINNAFWGLSAAKDNAAGAMAGVSSAISDAVDGVPDDMYDIGENIDRGLANGMNDYAYLVDQAADRIARAPSKVITFVNQMKSPSRLMMSHGRNIVEGLAIGVDEKAKRLEKSMEDLALSGNQAYLDERISSMEALPASFGYPGMSGGTTNTHTTNFGGVTLQIYQQPGEDAQDLAYRVMDLIQAEVEQQEVALYG